MIWILEHILFVEKKEKSYDKKPLQPQKNLKKNRDNTQKPPKTSITQRFRTDLGR